MSLTPLDVGLPRFLEVDYVVCMRNQPTPDEFASATRKLIFLWPILGSRLSFLRSELLHCKEMDHLSGIWKGRRVNKYLEDVIPVPKNKARAHIVDVQSLEGLADFDFGWFGSLCQRVFGVRTVFLQDACIVGFKIQHPLCDASGVDMIVRAYMSLLNGRDIKSMEFSRPSLQWKQSLVENPDQRSAFAGKHEIATLHYDILAKGWPAFFNAAVRQKARNICHPSRRRTSKTLFMPRKHIDHWMKKADNDGIRITEHDLLLAFIYNASHEPGKQQTFGVIMNIQRQLELTGPLSNPWCLIPIRSQVVSTNTTKDQKHLAYIANDIRRTITAARHPDCISQIIDQHLKSQKRPWVARSFGARPPNTIVTSWTHLPVLDVDVNGENPLFLNGNVDVCSVLRSTGTKLDDLVVTWKKDGDECGSDGGYCVHGRLSEAVWSRMLEALC